MSSHQITTDQAAERSDPSRPVHVSTEPLSDSTMEIPVIAEGLHLLKNFLEGNHSCVPGSFHLVTPYPPVIYHCIRWLFLAVYVNTLLCILLE